MTREDKIRDFVQKVRFWLAVQGERIVELEDNGQEAQDEWEQIMMFVEEAEWVLVSIYDPTYLTVKEDGVTAALNFLASWTDAEIDQFISDWKTRWGVGESAAVSLALETITLLEGGSSGGSGGDINLPAGDKAGDHLVSVGGGQLAWETPETVYDMGETTT